MIEAFYRRNTGEQLLNDLVVCHSPRKMPHRQLPATLLWHVADGACPADSRETAAPKREVSWP
jgi:hypothetical protein